MSDTTETTATATIPDDEYRRFLEFRDRQLVEYRNRLDEWAGRALSNGARPEQVNEALFELGLPPRPSTDPSRIVVRYRVEEFIQLNVVGDDRNSREAAEGKIQHYQDKNREFQRIEFANRRNGYAEPDGGKLEWQMPDGSWVDGDTFWAARTPATPPTPVNDLDQLKAIARRWVLRLARENNWCAVGIRDAFRALDLGRQPRELRKTVRVPVTGTVELAARYWEGDDDATVQADVDAYVARTLAGGVYITDGRVVEAPAEPAAEAPAQS